MDEQGLKTPAEDSITLLPVADKEVNPVSFFPDEIGLARFYGRSLTITD